MCVYTIRVFLGFMSFVESGEFSLRTSVGMDQQVFVYDGYVLVVCYWSCFRTLLLCYWCCPLCSFLWGGDGGGGHANFALSTRRAIETGRVNRAYKSLVGSGRSFLKKPFPKLG